MATWTNISDTFLEPGKPVRSVDGLALRDNPIAIAEGATGAPKINPIGAMAHGGNVANVGTYAFAYSTENATRSPGFLRAGSGLRYSNANGNSSGSLPGTWRLMGYLLAGSANTIRTSLWLRVS